MQPRVCLDEFGAVTPRRGTKCLPKFEELGRVLSQFLLPIPLVARRWSEGTGRELVDEEDGVGRAATAVGLSGFPSSSSMSWRRQPRLPRPQLSSFVWCSGNPVHSVTLPNPAAPSAYSTSTGTAACPWRSQAFACSLALYPSTRCAFPPSGGACVNQPSRSKISSPSVPTSRSVALIQEACPRNRRSAMRQRRPGPLTEDRVRAGCIASTRRKEQPTRARDAEEPPGLACWI
jgi:hypothetical protein